MSQQLLEQGMTVSQILQTHGRCAIGVIMSYYGWDGKDWTGASSKLFAALFALRHAGISTDLMIDLNDSGMTFDEIADYLDRSHVLTAGKC
jgi:hypothetical protein